jgi:hypothetical protein
LLQQQRLEGPDLEDLLAKIRSDFGEAATIVEANRLRKGGVGGFFAKETYEVVVDVDEDAVAGPEDEDEDEDEFVPFTLDELATRVEDPTPDFSALLAEAVADWPAQDAIAEVEPVVAATPRVPVVEPGGLTAVTPPPTGVPEPTRSGASWHTSPDVAALAALGMPVDRLALPLRTDEPAAIALVRMLEQLPAPPPMPRSQGAVVAVVGDRARGLEVAAALGLPSSIDIVVASRRAKGADVRTIDEAVERRRAWRRRKNPTVVVVDAPFGVAGDPWAAEVIGALEPVVALGTVDAGRKPEDVRAWAEGLGGLDALAVDGVDETTTPAAVLAVGLPVALLDGAAATPARWAAVLTDRMATLAA